MIACDTSALSEFFRRSSANSQTAQTVATLIEEKQLALFGVVRQEILSGIKTPEQFARVEAATRGLPLHFADDADHVLAAQLFNSCRGSGIQGSAIDFLICAMAVNRNFQILTTDPDFVQYAKVIKIDLYGSGKS
jgi:predicted nucleic acid-binding protein